ncbi:GNAT family N-acetyltransferase [Sphingobacterium sp. UT-1RO-CII-1]|uniref:GNAT family N-acetyltransferase n=1 Tax=Sphingobacterium sp. UT-1RO-CII-1 TaxID=2995225 RepID=UPI002DD439E0|nr:GNAT family N-acetyltransferase [Sphingobacterium sp. UT-1RO-CII-1]
MLNLFNIKNKFNFKAGSTKEYIMERTEVVLNETNRGEIFLFSDDKKAGKMDISVKGSTLKVYHTEVDEVYNGRGFARILLDKLVAYARENSLKIIPLCPYVHGQFKRRPEEYADVWLKNDE